MAEELVSARIASQVATPPAGALASGTADSARPALILTDVDQKIIAVNEAASRLCGFPAKELAGRSITVISSTTFAAPQPGYIGGQTNSLGQHQSGRSRRILLRRRDGSVLSARLRVQTLSGGRLPLFLGHLSADVAATAVPSNPPSTADEIVALPPAVPKLLAGISHDLGNFMNAVLGMSRLGSKIAATGERDALRSHFDTIECVGLRMMLMLNGLVDLGKLDAGLVAVRARDHDVSAVINTVCTEFRGLLAEKLVQLQYLSASVSINACVDAALLARVVSNLLSNALKFTPKHGWIEIDTRRIDDTIEVSVEDNGPGIPMAERHRLFIRFTQLSGADHLGGAGLGLAICSELLAAHHGKIWIETGRSGGARFVFRLPVAPMTAP